MGSLRVTSTNLFVIISFIGFEGMETPGITTRRAPSQAPMPSKVRQNYVRDRLVSAEDSGFSGTPTTGSPRRVHMESTPDVRIRRTVGPGTPVNPSRALHEMDEFVERTSQSEKSRRWRTFWLVWFSLLSISTGLVAA